MQRYYPPGQSNTAPELTPAELRHRGHYTVAYHDEGLGQDVAAGYRSAAFALEKAGRNPTPQACTRVAEEVAFHGRCDLGAGVVVYPR